MLDQLRQQVSEMEGDPILNLAELVKQYPQLELTQAEIAYCTNLPVATIKKLEESALRKLRWFAKNIYQAR